MRNWQHDQEKQTAAQHILSRLTSQILRLQRLAILKRLQHTERMVQIHLSSLAKQPGGAAQIKQLKEKFAEARRKLSREKHND